MMSFVNFDLQNFTNSISGLQELEEGTERSEFMNTIKINFIVNKMLLLRLRVAASAEQGRGRSWIRFGISINQEVSRGHSSWRNLAPAISRSQGVNEPS
jgi:hypothetical protein